MANPRNEPKTDILIRSSFDFINNTISKITVALRLAIFAALIGQNGLIIVNGECTFGTSFVVENIKICIHGEK